VHDEPVDSDAGRGGVQREGRAGRVPVDGGRATGRGDDGRDVLDLAGQLPRRRPAAVVAVAPAAAVDVEHRQVPGEGVGQGCRDASGAGGAGQQDDSRAVAEAVERDPGAVRGRRGLHLPMVGRLARSRPPYGTRPLDD
jgi:hypothetical protein